MLYRIRERYIKPIKGMGGAKDKRARGGGREQKSQYFETSAFFMKFRTHLQARNGTPNANQKKIKCLTKTWTLRRQIVPMLCLPSA